MLTWLKNHPLATAQQTWDGWSKHDGFLLSAAMAYYCAFSLFPLLLVLISVLGFVMQFSTQAGDAQQQLLDFVGKQAGPWLSQQLGALLGGVKSHALFGGRLGILALLAAAIGVFLQLDTIFDRIFDTTPTDTSGKWLTWLWNLLRGRLVAFLMLLIVGALIVAVFIANIVLAGMFEYVESFHQFLARLPGGETIWAWGQLGVTILTDTLLFSLIYRFLPKVRILWRDALFGGAVVACVWIFGQHVLVSLVIGRSYTAYGIVGSFIAVMIWLYYASAVLFFGAEFVQVLSSRRKKV